ncbi:exodeoxyribonuclease V subunit beta [Sedimenticola hydrogenitrophicus]|uniref:exodeoxyribonuclease V subunit beta n=1 Tax=Sedimenticola hydrogenitrophicus TaxID=2967975 RepID=UPI0021A3707B|nr:exodeoxyribonuclease V subunit beta [Sedimenticola hydrogenitrophicus]
MRRLDLFETPLDGMNLIEASAGTGKTYTITGLYIRLILEQGLTVEQILVVTYTKAATAELRERIRSRMVQLKRAVEGDREDGFRDALMRDPDTAELRLQRLTLAILSFDKAAIFTIHGFCQRLLAENAFESGMPFHTELLLDERPLMQEVVDDYWRSRIQDIPPGLLGYLLDQGLSPDLLTLALRGNINKPYLEIRGQAMPADLSAAEAEFSARFDELRQLWLAQRDAVLDQLKRCDGLNRNKYRSASIDKWALAMDLYLQPTPGPRFSELEKFSSTALAAALNKSGRAPDHPLFDRCESLLHAIDRLDRQYEQARVALLGELIQYANEQLRMRKQRLRVQSYDDLLLNLQTALDGERGAALVERVRLGYSAALIDEFQDTDPVQYRIFHRLFVQQPGLLFLVGDPKQAIYSFRGADIFAYLRAGADAGKGYTLDVNWRSVPPLIEAVNRLFDQPQGGFLFPQIPFQPSRPAETEQQRLLEQDGDDACFRVGFISGKQSKEQASQIAVDWTAREIARLTGVGPESGTEGPIRLGERSLAGGDIAVLVRTHRQGELIRHALAARGIHSVQRAQQDVFQTHEASELERLLRAVLEPQREGLVFAALGSDLLGVSGDAIAGLATDEGQLTTYLEQFQHYHRLWLAQGFMRMFRHLMREQRVTGRLLALPDGERRMTNTLHLSELIHQQERDSGAGMEALIGWLSRLRLGDLPEDEQRQLRLESDDNLVQIVTIHKSKGLQYPVVFCPFVWDGGLRAIREGEGCRFHDPQQQDRAVLDLGSPAWPEARRVNRTETLAESLRLLYVALTRARQRCYITWGEVNGAAESPLAWLLHPPPSPRSGDQLEALAAHFRSLDQSQLLARLQQWAEPLSGQVRITPCEAAEAEAAADLEGESGAGLPASAPRQRHAAEGLRAEQFTRRLGRGAAVTSFSALTVGSDHFDRPDHDEIPVLVPVSVQVPTEAPAELPATRSRFSFPRGANPGSCLHAIFEQLDFSRHSPAELSRLVQQQLAAYGIDPVWRDVVRDMVSDVLDTPLEPNSERCLRHIPKAHCLVEMEFNYPVAQLQAPRLAALLTEQGFAESEVMAQAIHRLAFSDISGYLKGFIDLIFVHEGRYHLLDYKSNWLGDQPADYSQTHLVTAMAGNGYFLQYLLYSVALHRYLARRLPDYDYECHFGSVYYLFLRGMSPADGTEFGVYRERPAKRLIEALDRYFTGEEVPV